jgi:hypothetical protein
LYLAGYRFIFIPQLVLARLNKVITLGLFLTGTTEKGKLANNEAKNKSGEETKVTEPLNLPEEARKDEEKPPPLLEKTTPKNFELPKNFADLTNIQVIFTLTCRRIPFTQSHYSIPSIIFASSLLCINEFTNWLAYLLICLFILFERHNEC